MSAPEHTTPAPANDNTPRPAWYDRELENNLPFIRFKARFHVAETDIEDLVSDTCILALRHWSNYRPQFAFTTWLGWVVRSAARDLTHKRAAKMRAGKHVPIDDLSPARCRPLSVDGGQDAHMSLADLAGAIPDGRDGEVLLRRLAGEELREIALEMGVCYQRVSQIEKRAMAKARKAAVRLRLVKREVG